LVPAGLEGSADALAKAAARIAELERRIAALEQTRFTPVAGLPPGEMEARAASVSASAPAPAPAVEAAVAPQAAAVPQPSVEPVAAWSGTHRVREGETLSSIARVYGTNFSELVRVNGIRDPDHIRSGQTLAVPGAPAVRSSACKAPEAALAPAAKAPAAPKTPAAKPPAAPKVEAEESYYYYPVTEGDTMASVAAMFFTTPSEVGSLNGIKSTAVLQGGQQLVVPTRRYFEEKARRDAAGTSGIATNGAGPVESP
jgi:membrane-bound lytic murein transglycosylase D